MLRRQIGPALAAVAAASLGGMAIAAPPAAPRAEIPFADHGGVENWQAVGDREIWFEDQHRRWYRAVLVSPAFDLPFVEHIGIDARPMGTLDRFGGVFVKGRHYAFQSFEAMPGPPPKKVKRRH
jgi:hypothetical protein